MPFGSLVQSCHTGLRCFFSLLVRQRLWLAMAALVVVIAEIVTQYIAPEYANRVYDECYTNGQPLAINTQLHRGLLVTEPKPDDTFRILALGDSVTFGTGVSAEECWATQLQNRLQKRTGLPCEVLNTGLAATDLRQIRLEIEKRWAGFAPNVAVLVVTGNMVSLGWIRQNEPVSMPRNRHATNISRQRIFGLRTQVKRKILRLALPGLLLINIEQLKYFAGLNNHNINPVAPYGVMLAHGWKQNDLDPKVVAQSWAILEEQLIDMKRTMQQLNIPLYVSYSLPRFALTDRYIDNLKWVPRNRLTIDPVDRTRKICQRICLPFVDPRHSLISCRREHATKGDWRPMYVLSDYTHLDSNGHAALATAIDDKFAEFKESQNSSNR
jgi:lysophospholipase L1-like esterase